MSIVLEAVATHARHKPQHIALDSRLWRDNHFLSYQQLYGAVCALSQRIEHHMVETACIAIHADNIAITVVADLACVDAKIVTIPVPLFFSAQQFHHLLKSSSASIMLTTMPSETCAVLRAMKMDFQELDVFELNGAYLTFLKLFPSQPQLLSGQGVAKITYTSGSTGEPKGVCLSQQAMEQVAKSLCLETKANAHDKHLCLLPYATLLENIGGIYAPLLAGATICLPSLKGVGMQGASGLDVQVFMQALTRTSATTCIMIPQMLQALVMSVLSGMPKPECLRYIAVGGAPVSLHLLQQAETLGLPVYEGYGLSEAASVVAMNKLGDVKAGSVGKPLPHVELDFADDNEILVRGSLFLGYLDEETSCKPVNFWPTGDVGYLDNEGFLYLTGRKKHMFITAFGRNVSPEWVERELMIEPAIAQACVFGEAKPFNVAVIVLRAMGNMTETEQVVAQAVQQANQRLPDYAQIRHWVVADAFSVENGLWTGTGRPRRQQIWQRYEKQIQIIYEENT